jgi:hypothetical protein
MGNWRLISNTLQGGVEVKNEFLYRLGWLNPITFIGEDLALDVFASDKYAVDTVVITHMSGAVEYWVSSVVPGWKDPERREMESDTSGQYMLGLRPVKTYHMTSSDQGEMLRLMRRVMSYNRKPLGPELKRIWEKALRLVRQAEVVEEEGVLLWEEGTFTEDEFDWIDWGFGEHDPNW